MTHTNANSRLGRTKDGAMFQVAQRPSSMLNTTRTSFNLKCIHIFTHSPQINGKGYLISLSVTLCITVIACILKGMRECIRTNISTYGVVIQMFAGALPRFAIIAAAQNVRGVCDNTPQRGRHSEKLSVFVAFFDASRMRPP